MERDNRATGMVGHTFSVENLPAVAARNEHEPGLTALYAVASATASDTSHASHQYFRQRYELGIKGLSKDIADRQRSGEYRSDFDPEWAARLLIGVFDGIQLQWLYDKGVSMQEGLRQAITLLKMPQPSGVL